MTESPSNEVTEFRTAEEAGHWVTDTGHCAPGCPVCVDEDTELQLTRASRRASEILDDYTFPDGDAIKMEYHAGIDSGRITPLSEGELVTLSAKTGTKSLSDAMTPGDHWLSGFITGLAVGIGIAVLSLIYVLMRTIP